MLHKFPVGTKEQNDLLILPQGAVCIDGVNSIRIHNGEQSGGGVLGLNKVDIPSPFRGEVPVSELINGTDLASLVGLSVGTAFNNNEPWLKFIDPVDGKTKFIAKKPYRCNLSWDQLNTADIVYGKTITIGSNQYICRLIKGSNSDPYVGSNGYDTEGTWGSEWNRLMYPICAPTGNPEYDIVNDPSSPGLGAWAQYNQETDLFLLNGDGRYTLCQEFKETSALYRGLNGVGRVGYIGSWVTSNNYGWRPLLELTDDVITGQRSWMAEGQHIWIVPEGVYSISCLVVQGGARGGWGNTSNRYGGRGGNVRWQNNISVIPGQELHIVVGAGGARVQSSSSSLAPGSGSHSSVYNLTSNAPIDNINIFGGDGANGTVGNQTRIAIGGGSGNLTRDANVTDNGKGMFLNTGLVNIGGLGVGGQVSTGGIPITASKGVNGGVRIIWGPNRAYPDLNIHDM